MDATLLVVIGVLAALCLLLLAAVLRLRRSRAKRVWMSRIYSCVSSGHHLSMFAHLCAVLLLCLSPLLPLLLS